jgi:hypothetical protein
MRVKFGSQRRAIEADMTARSPQYTLLFRGAAIGTVDFQTDGEIGGGPITPLPGFEAVRGALEAASRALANLGYLPPVGQAVGGVNASGDRAGRDALARAQAICDELELRDERGALTPTDWINVFGGRTTDEPLAVMAAFRRDPAGVRAVLPPSTRRGGDGGSRLP